jgi:hypothetical protein
MVDVSAYPDDAIVRELGRRFRCSACGSRNVDARPDWVQYGEHYRAEGRALTAGADPDAVGKAALFDRRRRGLLGALPFQDAAHHAQLRIIDGGRRDRLEE